MKRLFRRAAFGLVAVALSCPVFAQSPAAPERIRFVYRFAETPAAGLVASLTDPQTAEARRIVLDADGSLLLPADDHRLTLLDPLSGLTLFVRHGTRAWTRPADGVVHLPLPVRVVGALHGWRTRHAEAIAIHHGSGARLSVGAFQRRTHGLRDAPRDDENTIWGLTLPTIATDWASVRPRRDRSFDTGWIALTAPAQLAIAGADGEIATREVPLPDTVEAHAVLQAGAIAPGPSTTIEIDRAAWDGTDLPLVLRAQLDDAVIADDAGDAALRAALLEIVAPSTAHFLGRRAPLPLALSGVTRITGLPPLARADVAVAGPTPGLVSHHALTIRDRALVRIVLAAERRTPPSSVQLTGQVRSAAGRPVADATVVLASYPDRAETRTDAEGRFAFDDVATQRQAVVFVDAPSTGAPPFDRVTFSQRLEIPADSDDLALTLDAPPGAAPVTEAFIDCLNQPATDPLPYVFQTCGDTFTQSEQLAYCPVLGAYRTVGGSQEPATVTVTALAVEPAGGQANVTLEVPIDGTYSFILSYTPFVYATADAVLQTGVPVTIPFQPPAPWASTVIAVNNQAGQPAGDTEVAFPNWVYAADAYNDLTNDTGNITIDCFNLDPVPAFVKSDGGCFDGAVQLRASGVNIQLGDCDGF
ncbi:MAG: carboxypeptidase-like regulatory domain-containing protein [Acidobacteriota bacterium]